MTGSNLPQPTADAIEALVAQMTLDEKASLTSGADNWSTVGVPRLGIPKIWMTDGPNGARGAALPGAERERAVCVPCGSGLGATWDAALIEEVGEMLGREVRARGCRVLLGPTVNLQRSPLGGRDFESYGEDPVLSGRIAAAYIRGAQSQGVATTVKHFAGNDAEYERSTINSVIDTRTLREVTMVPFEYAVRFGGSLGMMTGYNRLNGPFCSEHPMLRDVVRAEWGFEGFVVSDWLSRGSTVGGATAGLDLEMPGPPRWFGPAVAAAVRAGELDEALLDEQVRRMLSVWARLGAFGDPDVAASSSPDLPQDRALARRAATASMVLLRNEQVLPLPIDRLGSLAVIGPNAAQPMFMGGGSASLEPHHRTTPLEAIRARWGDRLEIVHEPGCDTDFVAPPVAGEFLTAPDGEPGFLVEFFRGTRWIGESTATDHNPMGRMLFFDAPAPGVRINDFSFRASATLTVPSSGPHRISLVQAGLARVSLDGIWVIDGVASPPPLGTELFGFGSVPVEVTVELVAGHPHELVVEYSSETSTGIRGAIVGLQVVPPVDLMDRAVAAAAAADAVVLIVGANAAGETEGRDRVDMRLPGETDRLVEQVLAANPNTVVVLNTGAAVELPWAGRARAILQAWFAGQELAEALVDVLEGVADPGGRLPITFPVRLEHNPSFGNFPGENSEIRYGEGLLVGHRWYEARHLPVRYPFGHGLSYSTFSLSTPRPSASEFVPGQSLRVEIDVTNTGDRRGSEVVQCYVAPINPRLFRPVKELKAFAKVNLEPGEQTTVTLELGDRDFAYFDPGDPAFYALGPGFMTPSTERRRPESGWFVDPGSYELHIGRSSAEISAVVPIVVTAPADGVRLAGA